MPVRDLTLEISTERHCASGGGCGISGGYAAGYGKGYGPILPANENGAITAGGWNGYPVYTVGSVADIPVDSIVAFVHNAV